MIPLGYSKLKFEITLKNYQYLSIKASKMFFKNLFFSELLTFSEVLKISKILLLIILHLMKNPFKINVRLPAPVYCYRLYHRFPWNFR